LRFCFCKWWVTLQLLLHPDTVNPFCATIQSSIPPIPCKTLSPSPLPCYPLPCISNPIPARPCLTHAEPPFPSAFPNLLSFQRSNVPTIFDLTLLGSHPNPLLCCQQTAPVNPLAATPMDLPTSVANKRLTEGLNSFRCNTYKKTGGGGVTAFPRFYCSARSAGILAPQILSRRPRFPHTS